MNSLDAMDRPYERVYTVMDFYDGPRVGFADFEGQPHAYRSVWRHELDDWDPDQRFELSPITAELLALALEDWAIWRRWEEAFYAGETPQSEHPALPADRPRHEVLAPIIAQGLDIDLAARRVAKGEFRACNAVRRNATLIPTSRAELEVRWTLVEVTSPVV